jgi:hypothetical protein
MLLQLRHASVALLSTLLLFAVSCKKDKDPHPQPQAKKLTKIAEGPDDYNSFSWNPDGSLKTMTVSNSFDTGKEVYTVTLSYLADKKINEAVYSNGNKLKFFYENGKLTKTELADNKGVLLNISTFQYNFAGRLSTYTAFGAFPLDDGTPGTAYKQVYKTEYSYFTAHDSLVHEAVSYKRNAATKQLEKWNIVRSDAYDDKKNPLSALGDFGIALFRHSSKCNVTDDYLYDDQYTLLERTENDFIYDNDGYPLLNRQKVTDPLGQTPSFYTITYTYQ